MPKPTRENPLIISASELRDFLRCRVRWWWRHQVRIEPLERPLAFAMGTMGHAILEAWYKLSPKKRTVKSMTRLAAKMVRDTSIESLSPEDAELLQAMLVGYAQWAAFEDQEAGLTGDVETEMFFEYPLVPDDSILVRGYLDLHFKSSAYRKTVAFVDSKFVSQIRVDNTEMNLQMSVYLWALRKKYPKMKRFMGYYQMLRKQMPGPRVKADLFWREPTERTPEEIDQWERDTANAALDMINCSIYPNPMDSCSWSCDFKTPCLLRGTDDLVQILKSQYKVKESR